ncbi:MAG TPA: sulfatase-like hydrolase/transferase, partial [Humisphaera sp.]|nr:sulfatase-like hydrolase/transferase [Humisphaera sp.]
MRHPPLWRACAIISISLICTAAARAGEVGAAAPVRKPNIIFILIDDMGWRDLGCCGSTFYETPNIDRLAAGGMRFTQAYAAAPVCSPTRASIMTGKYPARVGVTDWIGAKSAGRLLDAPYIHHLPLTEVSLAKALKQAGYQTWHLGKWHLGERNFYPDRHGFDVNVGGCELGHQPSYFSPYRIPTLKDGPKGEFLTDRLTDEAIALIEKSDGRPFFMNFWHYAVHAPIQAPVELIQKYRDKAHRLKLDSV